MEFQPMIHLKGWNLVGRLIFGNLLWSLLHSQYSQTPGGWIYLVTVRREASGSDLFPLVSQSSNRRVSISYFLCYEKLHDQAYAQDKNRYLILSDQFSLYLHHQAIYLVSSFLISFQTLHLVLQDHLVRIYLQCLVLLSEFWVYLIILEHPQHDLYAHELEEFFQV